MKRGITSEERISNENALAARSIESGSQEETLALAFIVLLGEMCDAIAQGDNIYMTIGANKARTALVATLNDGAGKTYAAGHDLFDMVTHALEAF